MQRARRWLTKLRLILVGHEELTAIVFWAALIGIGGALASVAFRELIHALEWAITGNSGGLVAAASSLGRIHRVMVPVLGGVAAGLVIQLGAAWFYAKRSVDYMEAVLRDNVTALPVISGRWRARLLGVIARHDLLLALQDRLSDKRSP